MGRSHQKAIRDVLRSSGGMTVTQVAKALGITPDVARSAIKWMPDAYIDRWDVQPTHSIGIWCVVDVPENCPRPSRRGMKSAKRKQEATPGDQP